MIPFIYFYGIVSSTYIASLFKFKPKSQNCLFVFLSVIVFSFMGFRAATVGTDTGTYVYHFHYAESIKLDIGYEYLVSAIRIILDSEEYFIFATSIFSFLGIFILINSLSYRKILSLFLFVIAGTTFVFLLESLSAIRQFCALSLYLVAVLLYFEKVKNCKIISLAIYIFAFLIHASVIFSLPFLLVVSKVHISRRHFWIVLIICTYLFSVNPWFSITSLLNFIFTKFEFIFSERYLVYSQVMNFGIIEKGWFNMFLLPFSLIGIVIVYLGTLKELNLWYVKLFIFSIIVNNIFSNNLMWARLVIYLSFFIIIAVPNVMAAKPRIVKLMFYLPTISYFLYKVYGQLSFQLSPLATGNIVVPYSFWFQ